MICSPECWVKPEFSHRIVLAEIGTARTVALTADASERAALAKRLNVLSIDALMANAEIGARAAGIEAQGAIEARVTQACVASGEPVEQVVTEPFEILFVAPGSITGDEIELSAEECDQIEHDGLAIDLAEAVAQTLALALDPFPRAPEAEVALAKAGVVAEGEEAVGPFAALKALK